MPTEPLRLLRPASLAAAALLATIAAQAQTDDTTPFYIGGSAGVSRVANVYREPNATNDDTVTSIGLLAGIDQRLGRQHLTFDGSIQNNRYATNKELDYRSSTLRAALNWQTVGSLSGVLSAKSDRSLADFNVGNNINPIRQKNIESNDEYQATARLGMGARYRIETGWTNRRRDFTAEAYDRLVYRQNAASLGVYAMPGGNVWLGLVGRHTKGNNPRYPVVRFVSIPGIPQPVPAVVIERNDYSRDDLDFTTNWKVGGSTSVNTRISRSKTQNSIDSLRDFSGTTGAIGGTWQPTGKLQLTLNYSRDTGQESIVQAADLSRVYTAWQLGGTYAVTGKVSLNAKASVRQARRTSDANITLSDAVDDSTAYNIGARWAISRGFSLGCQYDRVSRDSSVPEYVYKASSYGCTGQAIFY